MFLSKDFAWFFLDIYFFCDYFQVKNELDKLFDNLHVLDKTTEMEPTQVLICEGFVHLLFKVFFFSNYALFCNLSVVFLFGTIR